MKVQQEDLRNCIKRQKMVQKKCDPKKALAVMPRGRSLLLGPLDEMVQSFDENSSQGGVVSRMIAIATAKALIACNPHYNLSHIDLVSSAWAKSLFKKMGLTKPMFTTGKIEVLAGGKKETKLLFMHEIVATQYSSEPRT